MNIVNTAPSYGNNTVLYNHRTVPLVSKKSVPRKIKKMTTPAVPSHNFKGRIINDKNLKRLGDVSMYSTFASLGLSISLQNECLAKLNAILGVLATGAHSARLFIKNGELLELKPEITFTKADTIEQAANFAKENFKINSFAIDDLDTANWVNKGLTRLSNRFKGKTYMPSKIELADFGEKSCTEESMQGAFYSGEENKIVLNKRPYENIDRMLKVIVSLKNSLNINLGMGAGSKEFKRQADRYKLAPESFTNPEKISLWACVNRRAEVLQQIIDKKRIAAYEAKLSKEKSDFTQLFGNVNYNQFDFLYHEMGHLFDNNSSSLVSLMLRKHRASSLQKEIDELVIPLRARDSYPEFTAEIFSGIINGDVYPQAIMKLFHKCNNIKLPQ